MGDPRGFLKHDRQKGKALPVEERLTNFDEFELPPSESELRHQASRCMDCGIAYCHRGCPLGNLIPEWNDHVYRGDLAGARAALLATNNFPEITGRVCPAPCEAACVLNLEGRPVTIKEVERAIADDILTRELVPMRPMRSRRERVAVVGSGPAGLAAAQELARRGFLVTVFERDDRLGGLLRYGIPDFKLDKQLLERRLAQMEDEGVRFVTGVRVGTDFTVDALRAQHDAVVLGMGARRARELDVPGKALVGVYPAMDFLTQQNRRVAGDPEAGTPILAKGKRVVILGGGDTGSDCLGTALRQGAEAVMQLELLARPAETRLPTNPWPEWPLVFRTSSSQEEGGTRDFGVLTKEIVGDEQVRALRAVRVELKGGRLHELPGSEHEIPCDLVLLAMGFVGPEQDLSRGMGLEHDARGNVRALSGTTSMPGVFAAGDVSRGASLVVWAIADGRVAAQAATRYLDSLGERPGLGAYGAAANG